MKLALTEIVVDPTISPRRRLDNRLIEDYVEILDRLPPVLVYKTLDGKLLADGFHRFAAATRLGRTHLKAEVRIGEREDAIEAAVIANLSHGLRLTAEERRDAILRISQIHPQWSVDRLAETAHLSASSVEIVVTAARIKAEVPEAGMLPDTHAFILARAPAHHRGVLAALAEEKEWTRDELRVALQNIKDPKVADDWKEALLRGEAEPIATRDGEPAILTDTIARRLHEAKRNNLKIPLWEALEKLARLRQYDPAAVAQQMKPKDLEHLRRELPGDIDWLRKMLETTEKTMLRPTVVKLP